MKKNILAIAAVLAPLLFGVWWFKTRGRSYTAPTRMVARSEELRATDVEAGLDGPVNATRSLVWSAALGLAWKNARENVFHGPVSLPSGAAASLVQSLEAAPSSIDDATPDALSFFVGRADDPKRPRRGLGDAWDAGRADGEVVVDAVLDLSVRFPLPYFDADEPLVFKGGDGSTYGVRAFGITRAQQGGYEALRRQVRVLFRHRSAGGRDDFAIDLCSPCSSYEVIVASIPVPPNIGKGVALVDAMATGAATAAPAIGINDVVLVPEQAWDVVRVFSDLAGRAVLPSGAEVVLSAPTETVRFVLDRSGAELRTGASFRVYAAPVDYVFDTPYLVFVRRRGRPVPVFAAWVANTELLRRTK